MVFRDSVIGLFLVTLSVVFFIGTWEFPDVGGHVSPRVFPRVICGFMFLFAGILLLRSLVTIFRGRTASAPLPRLEPSAWMHAICRSWRLLAAGGVALAYVLFIDDVGYVVATALFLAAMTMLYAERRWYVIVPLAVVGTGVLYLTFRILFKVPLPRFDMF